MYIRMYVHVSGAQQDTLQGVWGARELLTS